MERRFSQLDVFTREPLRGNPLAVVHDGSGLSDAQMAAFARWTNLSETTFLLPPTEPGADYRVRIFTPAQELPFAGHPTLGSCHAWLAGGERQCVGRRAGADDADDLGGQAQCVARGDQAAGTRTQADRHDHRVERGQRIEQLERITRDASHQVVVERRHHVPAPLVGEALRRLARGLEVVARFDQLGAEGPHRRVLLTAVAVRHEDRHRQIVRPRRTRDRLAVVAARRAHHGPRGRLAAHQAVQVDQPAAYLERAHRRVVLVLDPQPGAGQALQQRPVVLRRGRHLCVHTRRSVAQRGDAEGTAGRSATRGGRGHGATCASDSSASCSTRPSTATPSAMSSGVSVTKLRRSVRGSRCSA